MIMKIKNLILGMLVVMTLFVSCRTERAHLDIPKLYLDVNEMTFDISGGEQSLSVTSTRDWRVECDADWVVVTPERGDYSSESQTAVISVLPNDGMDREVNVKFTIEMINRYVTVRQAGPEGSADQLIIYFNDYDKEEATKTYGSGESWPFLDQFDGWKNQTGTGAADVTYAFNGMSARANSTSNSNYSDYPGSGSNNMFFGSNAYIATKNIALNGTKDIIMTFGTEKYSQTLGSVFTPSEFHIYLSNDGNKWVELTGYTFAGDGTEGRWNVATAVFSVPEGTENLSVCMKVDAASAYRMDDLRLEVSKEAGNSVDFSAAVEMDFSAGSTGGGTVTPENIKDVTVSQFNSAAVSTKDWYRLKGTVGGPINDTYGNFDIIDETGKVYVYGISNWSEYKDKVTEGGSIVIVGQRGDYNGKIEVLEAYIESYTAGASGGVTPPSSEIKDVTVEQFNAAAVNNTDKYRLTGKVGGPINTTYGNFDVIDATGKVYVYGISNWSDYKDKVAEGGSIVVVGNRGDYNGKIEVLNGYIESYNGESTGGNEGGGNQGGGEAGDYDPQGITWTLGSSSYDNTSGSNSCQTAVVNGVEVANLLKLGTGSKVGNATLHVPAGTKKIGMYMVAWKGKKATLKATADGKEIASISPKANAGATGNPPYTITVTDADYYEIEINSDSATDVMVETLDPNNGRVLMIGLKAIK